ncbi:hypothetical protein ACG33_04750 [Steroidobacter denitrificans]|uniref:ATP-grasp domain-containing protein n=1 Tax=Steroidobacter denitrificans TaxID=465721 RepID=A0A127F7J6_STEDE|nr:ATP-grasp domain-containing protein [Steroidobacter denitrificans]AMN46422.1 hypothetical protein ACG33_04750 [Steroidobacter denitrificans]
MNLNPEVIKLLDSSRPVPIILGGYVNGLGLARALARLNLTSIILDYMPEIAFSSRFVAGQICPHPVDFETDFIQFLVDLGARLRSPGFLLCTNDIWLIPVSRNQRLLEPNFLFPMSPWKVIEKAITKSELYAQAKAADVPYPNTYYSCNLSELQTLRDVLTYPCVVKPSVTVGFMEAMGLPGRTVVVRGTEEFDRLAARILEHGLQLTGLIIQEQIPGGVENLYTITTYSNRDGEIIGYSIGHKIRQFPPDAGTIVAGRVKDRPELFVLAQRLIGFLGFHGIANTEFKLDPRDGIFKLIEINPRPGMWNYSALAAGINLPALAYREALGEKLSPVGGTQKEIVWIRALDDIRNSFFLIRHRGYLNHTISFRAWLDSIRGKKVDAVFQWSDPLPFIHDVMNQLWGVARVLRRRASIPWRIAFGKQR